MNLLCHRGIWARPEEKNSLPALFKAIDRNLGIETDVRDCNGQLVISHDLPIAGKIHEIDTLFSYYTNSKNKPCLALNIKADGLQTVLLEKLNEYKITNYFVFDMSVPDTLGYRRLSVPFAARVSEYEPIESIFSDAEFVWLDAFNSEWYSVEKVRALLMTKKIAVVSPELHKRPHLELWERLRPFADNENFYLCTDFVDEALGFFHAPKN